VLQKRVSKTSLALAGRNTTTASRKTVEMKVTTKAVKNVEVEIAEYNVRCDSLDNFRDDINDIVTRNAARGATVARVLKLMTDNGTRFTIRLADAVRNGIIETNDARSEEQKKAKAEYIAIAEPYTPTAEEVDEYQRSRIAGRDPSAKSLENREKRMLRRECEAEAAALLESNREMCELAGVKFELLVKAKADELFAAKYAELLASKAS
jgi:hypothetical protein